MNLTQGTAMLVGLEMKYLGLMDGIPIPFFLLREAVAIPCLESIQNQVGWAWSNLF